MNNGTDTNLQFTNVSELVAEHEQKAIVNLFGVHTSPSLQGEKDGMLLDANQKSKIELLILNEFHRQSGALTSKLSERVLELECALEQKLIALASIRRVITQLQTSKGGAHHGQMKIWEAAENLRRIAHEENSLLKQLAEEYEDKILTITRDFKSDRHIQELVNTGTIRDYKKITDIILQLGRFNNLPGKNSTFEGFQFLAQKRMLEILQTKLEYEKKLYDQRIKEVKDNIQLRIDSIHAQVNELPSRKEMWFNTLLTAIIFLVEVPLHYVFTSKALGLQDDEGIFQIILKFSFALGLPLTIGLIFKYLLVDNKTILPKAKSDRFSKLWIGISKILTPKRLTLIFLLLLIASIGLLNGIDTSIPRNKSQYRILLNVLKFFVFSASTVLLSFIGAIYFDKAKTLWQKRRVLTFSFTKEKKLAIHLESSRKDELVIEQEIMFIKKEIEKLNSAINHLHKNNIGTRFKAILDAVLTQYERGFEKGWRKRISDFFDKREPIPLNPSFFIKNKIL